MTPNSRIFLTRHAQAEHNVKLEFHIPDAPLTPLGKTQAAALATAIPTLQAQADLILSSPLKRTLQTTKLGWAPAISRLGGLPHVIGLPQAQECSDNPCDTGSSKETLASDPEFSEFDLDLLAPDWTSKAGFWGPDPEAVDARARSVRKFLLERPERNIVLVAHGDILRAITRGEKGFSDHPWRNAECRVFTFDPEFVGAEDKLYLKAEGTVAAAGGYAPTSAVADVVGGGGGGGGGGVGGGGTASGV